ncbi:MAG: hypothetical protein MR357_09210 [Anaeroplasma sp.]|nr:hypothetical protein [Anaeroplasma sp.]
MEQIFLLSPNDTGNYNVVEGTVVLYNSGGSDGGGGGGAPAAPDEKPQTEPVRSGTSTTVDLSSNTMSKGGQTATTLDKQTADKLIEVAAANKSQ